MPVFGSTLEVKFFSAMRRHPFVRHPIFPLALFVLASQALGEFYPFSPFSMYSNPTSRPLLYCYVTNGDGEPLPIQTHTGTSPASLTKNFNRIRHQIAEDREGDETTLTIRQEAGAEVLEYLRDLSFERGKGRELTQSIQLMEVYIGFAKEGGLEELETAIATLPEVAAP